jgi:hypothetical protein
MRLDAVAAEPAGCSKVVAFERRLVTHEKQEPERVGEVHVGKLAGFDERACEVPLVERSAEGGVRGPGCAHRTDVRRGDCPRYQARRRRATVDRPQDARLSP